MTEGIATGTEESYKEGRGTLLIADAQSAFLTKLQMDSINEYARHYGQNYNHIIRKYYSNPLATMLNICTADAWSEDLYDKNELRENADFARYKPEAVEACQNGKDGDEICDGMVFSSSYGIKKQFWYLGYDLPITLIGYAPSVLALGLQLFDEGVLFHILPSECYAKQDIDGDYSRVMVDMFGEAVITRPGMQH